MWRGSLTATLHFSMLRKTHGENHHPLEKSIYRETRYNQRIFGYIIRRARLSLSG